MQVPTSLPFLSSANILEIWLKRYIQRRALIGAPRPRHAAGDCAGAEREIGYDIDGRRGGIV